MKKSNLEKMWNSELQNLLEDAREELQDCPGDQYWSNVVAQYTAAENLLQGIEWAEVEVEYINDKIPTKRLEVSEKDFCIAAAKAMNGEDFDRIIKLAKINGCNGKNYNGAIFFNGEKIAL